MRALSFSPDLAEIRFGCGLSPVIAAPVSTEAMLQGLTGPDDMADRFPIEGFDAYTGRIIEIRRLVREIREVKGQEARAPLRERRRAAMREASHNRGLWAAHSMLRWAHTPTGFRERLVAFWADHFTVTGKTDVMRYANAAYVESAIRPHVAGSFADMLFAAATHPVMLDFLDQTHSAGNNSEAVALANGVQGMNENLAREVLELHTLGVGGPYSQQDVREFAELLTGITFRPPEGLKFFENWAEPGAETVLGKTYTEAASLDTIREALTDLALHPATAAHVARKLAVHFVSDTPEPELVSHIEARYLETGGDLLQVSGALLEHPAAWDPRPANVKPPFDFMASAFRALALPEKPIAALPFNRFRLRVFVPLSLMGQPWGEPSGPDGWPEEDAAWITPQSLSARLRWAIDAPQGMVRNLPDPRDFVDQALGSFATEPVRFAASAAESRPEAIGLVLCAPAFQRR